MIDARLEDGESATTVGRTHDTLCRPPWNYGSGGHCEGCDLIAAARADEREQAAQRIDGHSQHGYRCECGADLNNYENHLQNVIRGEEQ